MQAALRLKLHLADSLRVPQLRFSLRPLACFDFAQQAPVCFAIARIAPRRARMSSPYYNKGAERTTRMPSRSIL